MNIDGSNPRMVSGAWDRSPQGVTWKEDGTGVYFTAQDSGSQNLYFLPLAGSRPDEVQVVTKGTHMLTTASIAKGKAVGVLTSPQKPGDIVSYDIDAPPADEAVDRGQRRHPRGQEARPGHRDVVHVAGRPEDSRLVHHAAGLRCRPRNTRCSCTSMAARTACTASASTLDGRSTRPTAT